MSDDLEQIRADLKEIKNALIGSEYHKGMVENVKDIEARLSKLETFEKELSVYLKQIKVFIAVLLTTITGLIIKIFATK